MQERTRLATSAVALLLAAPVLTAPATAATRDSATTHSSGDPAVISEWNAIAVTTLLGDPTKVALEGYLYLGFMHAAVYNAVVGIEGRYEPYRFHARAPHRASAQAAAVAAAHKVLVTYSPYATDPLNAAYAASLAEIADGKAKSWGIAYGELAADTLIAQRVGDGRNDATIQWTQPPAPGVWRPTPPAFAPFTAPWLGYMKPLLIRSGAQFGQPGPPPAMTSRRYTRDFNEVKALGSNDPTTRSAKQNEIAQFYSGNPIVQFATALRDQAAIRRLDIVDSARMLPPSI